MSDLYHSANWENVPRDYRGIPISMGLTCPAESMHLQALKNVQDTTARLTATERRNIAISWALSNFSIKNHIPRELPTALRRPPQLAKKSKPRGVLTAQSRYRLPYHVGTHSSVQQTTRRRSALLSLLKNNHEKEPFTNNVLVNIKNTILFCSPKQLYIAQLYLQEILGEHIKIFGDDAKDNVCPKVTQSQSNARPHKRKRMSRRKKITIGSEQLDGTSRKKMTPEEVTRKEHELLIEIGNWASCTHANKFQINDIKTGHLLDFYDIETNKWHQALAYKETRRGIIIHLVWPIKKNNNQILLQKEHMDKMARPLFTHTDFLINSTFLSNLPAFETTRRISRVYEQELHNVNSIHRLYGPSTTALHSRGTGTNSSASKRKRNYAGTSLHPVSNDLVGKEVVLGESYNIRRVYLGQHAIVLGSAQSSGGWVDICIVNKDGSEGDHLRWRLHGLIELTKSQRKIAKISLIQKVIRDHYKDNDMANKILKRVL